MTMRKLLSVAAVAALLAACGDTTGPEAAGADARLAETAILAYSALHVGDPGHDLIARLNRLPPQLALSEEQSAQVRGLVQSFLAATEADRAALAAIMAQATEARKAGKPPEEVRAILARGSQVRTQLHAAERSLQAAVLALLTPAQLAWLTAGRDPRPCSTVTEAQRTEISGLIAAYEQANAADIALVRSVHERARAAQQAGATRAQVSAILAEGRAAMERLKAARTTVSEAISAVLTPEQRAAGCFR
jgi:Spy/CpxP family protein refolding chaperone